MGIEQFIRETYLLPPTLIEYHVSQNLKQLFPQKACIEVEDGRFDVEGYAEALPVPYHVECIFEIGATTLF